MSFFWTTPGHLYFVSQLFFEVITENGVIARFTFLLLHFGHSDDRFSYSATDIVSVKR